MAAQDAETRGFDSGQQALQSFGGAVNRGQGRAHSLLDTGHPSCQQRRGCYGQCGGNLLELKAGPDGFGVDENQRDGDSYHSPPVSGELQGFDAPDLDDEEGHRQGEKDKPAQPAGVQTAAKEPAERRNQRRNVNRRHG